MTPEILKQAQDALRITDVFQRVVSARLAEGYEPKLDSDATLDVQFKHNVMRSEVLKPRDGAALPKLFRVYIDIGVRWRHESTAEKDKDNERPMVEESLNFEEISDLLGLIEATYVAEYEFKSELEQPALDAFALHNASHHVWPFFREFVANQCLRMNVPKLLLPMVQFAANREAVNISEPSEDVKRKGAPPRKAKRKR